MIDFSHFQIVPFPLILFLMFLYVGETTSFYSAFENFPPMAAMLIPHQTRLKGYQSRISQFGFFLKFELIIAWVKIQWEPFRMTMDTPWQLDPWQEERPVGISKKLAGGRPLKLSRTLFV